MNAAIFIGKKIKKSGKGTFISTISKLTVFVISIGVAFLILTYAVLGGFKNTIKCKLYSFDSHVQIKKYELTDAFITSPLYFDSSYYQLLKTHRNVASVNTYGLSAGILQKDSEVAGVVFKGVSEDYDFNLFGENLIKGRLPISSNHKEILLSDRIAKQFQIDLGDKFVINFFSSNRPKPRKFVLCGVYETGIEEIDNRFVLGNLKTLQQVARWTNNEIGGYEVFLKNTDKIYEFVEAIEFGETTFYDTEIVMINEKYQYLFQWLAMIDQNAVILALIIFVIVFFNLLSTMYILVVDRTSTIGLLKALGGERYFLLKVFWVSSIQLVLKGLFIGNIIAIVFCYLQSTFQLIPLDPENYYMSAVPILWNWTNWFLVNVCSILTVGLLILLPISSIVRMAPVNAIKFS